MSDPIRVLVADDSATARRFLVELLNEHPGVIVVGEARDGAEAVELTARLRPSIVVMDAVMPRLDGFAATERIMKDTPTPVLVVTAALDPRDVALALRSVEVGALAVTRKPVWPDRQEARRAATDFARKVVTLSSVSVIQRRRPTTTSSIPVVSSRAQRHGRSEIIAIAASTGGPQSLHRLLQAMPAPIPSPIVVVQHIAVGFVHGFVSWLDAGIHARVKVAEDNEPARPGVVYIAPDGHHLAVHETRRLRLVDGPLVEGFRPAGNVLFESIAQTYGPAGLGIVLSGLGQDGLAGLASLHAAGGCVLAQDPRTAPISSMPAAVVDAGIADVVGSPEELAAAATQLITGVTR